MNMTPGENHPFNRGTTWNELRLCAIKTESNITFPSKHLYISLRHKIAHHLATLLLKADILDFSISYILRGQGKRTLFLHIEHWKLHPNKILLFPMPPSYSENWHQWVLLMNLKMEMKTPKYH